MNLYARLWMGCAMSALLLGACRTMLATATNMPSSVSREMVVSLTFDDGDADNFASAAVLRQYGLRATWYIPSGLVGKPGYMTWDELQALQVDGNEIGGHSIDHINIGGLDAAELRHQVCDDREDLQAHGFAPVSFAYPFGGYDEAAKNMVAECGYFSARSIGAGAEGVPPVDALALRAYPYIVSDTNFSKLQRYITGARNEGLDWVILVFHHVCDACDYYAVRPDVLHRFIPWLAEQQSQDRLKVATVSEVVQGGDR